MILKRIKAGALQFSMFIVVMIALLLAAFIVFLNTYNQFKVQTDFVKETIENADMGIKYALNNDIPINDSLNVPLTKWDYKTIKVSRSDWGLFEVLGVNSKIKSNQFEKLALVGTRQTNDSRPALYLEDNNKPLVLVGTTKIEGLTFIPKQGVRTGNISGHSYYGSQLTYGETKTSEKLPELSGKTQNYLEQIPRLAETIKSDQFLDFDKRKRFKNSFLNPVKVIFSPNEINLQHTTLIGHILIQSETRITLDATSNLKDVVLMAPQIEIRKGTKGRFQALAVNNIFVGKDCKLSYPTALVVREGSTIYEKLRNGLTQQETSLIKINKGSQIEGVIVYWGHTNNYDAQVFIDNQAEITGEVYCNRNLELKGKVNGSVYAANFVAHESGSSYQNHIYNGVINSDNLPKEYIGLPWNDSEKGIMKWLY